MIIGIDMDGVIVDTTPALVKQANDACKTKLTIDDVNEPSMAKVVWGHISEKRKRQMGVEEPTDLNSWLFPPTFFTRLNPVDGAIEAVRRIASEHQVVIITKPVEWSCCPYEKEDWLKKYLSDVPYKLIMTDSMDTKGLIGVDVMIDDDPRVIKALKYAVGVIVKQPWNKSYIDDLCVESVESLDEIFPVLLKVQSELSILE